MAAKDRPGVKIPLGPKLEKDEGLSPLITEACEGIDELMERDVAGEPAVGPYTVRTRKLDLRPEIMGRGGAGSPPQAEGEPGAFCQGYRGRHADDQLLGTGAAKGAADGPALP